MVNESINCNAVTVFGCPSIAVTADYDDHTPTRYLGLGRGIYGLPVPRYLSPTLPVSNTVPGQGYYALNVECGSSNPVSAIEFYVSNPGYVQILVS